MIALEHVKRFRLRDFLFIIVLAMVWWALSFSVIQVFGPQSSYMVSVLIAGALLSFCVLLVQRAGAATLFLGLGSWLGSSIPDIGPTGYSKVFAFIAAGLIFEAVFLVAKLEWKLIQVDILAATSIAFGFLPLLLILFLSPIVAVDLLVEALNLSFISFFIGVISSTISFLVWYHLSTTKELLKFMYEA